MMTGVVNGKGEAIVRLVVGNFEKKTVVIDAVVDTGYTGYLTLTAEMISTLGLAWLGSEEGILGDGSTQDFDVYSARIIWDGEFKSIKVNESETQPLLGVGLLYGYEICIQTIANGTATIKALTV